MLTPHTHWNREELTGLYDESLATSSLDRQAIHLSEEVSECNIEVSKLLRGRTTDTDHLSEEIADVMIMLDEIRHLFGITQEQVSKMIGIKLEKFSMRVFNKTTKPLPMEAYELFARTRACKGIFPDEEGMDLRMLAHRCVFKLKTAEELDIFVKHFISITSDFGLCYNLISAINSCCVATGPMTLASYGLIPKVCSKEEAMDSIIALCKHAWIHGRLEGIDERALHIYLDPYYKETNNV